MTLQNFLARLAPQPNGCLFFTGAVDRKGYGHLYVGGGRAKAKYEGAHRFAYRMAFGEIPAGKYVLHKCDKPLCCNPEHLTVSTQADNMRDAATKGRARNRNTGKTHCQKGHEFTEENTYKAPGTKVRQCRACIKAKAEAGKDAKRLYDAARYRRLRDSGRAAGR